MGAKSAAVTLEPKHRQSKQHTRHPPPPATRRPFEHFGGAPRTGEGGPQPERGRGHRAPAAGGEERAKVSEKRVRREEALIVHHQRLGRLQHARRQMPASLAGGRGEWGVR